MITPTPTPSETLTNTRSPAVAGVVARAPTICASAQARPEFSICTGSPVAAASGSRRSTLRQPSVGACSTRIVECSTMPGTTTPMPSQASSFRMLGEQRLDARRERGDQLLGIADGREA